MTRTGRANSIIWKTVVSAGAMLGAPACGGKAATPATAPIAAEAPPPAPEPAPPPPPVEPAPGLPPPVDWQPAPAEEPAKADEPSMAIIRVLSTPAGADVYVDGQLVGRTPLELPLPYGSELNVKVQRDGYADKTMVVKTESDQTIEVALVKNKKKVKRPRGTGEGRSQGRGFILS